MVNPSVINTVLAKAIEVATHSWEYGSVAQALLEWNNATLSIWNNPFPNNQVPTLDWTAVDALEYVYPHIRTDNITLVDGDGAAGDPAALGISALLIGKTLPDYYAAAIRQADHLTNDVPRWANGAISHREAWPELWADFIYMVPPFLAYYAVASSNLALLKESATQAKLYRDGLEVTADGVWLHIRGTHGTIDLAPWSSGNGWAAAGMSRVLATLRKSQYDAETKEEQDLLIGLIKEILDGAIALDVDPSELLRNYLDDASWWGEISGTSLLAATAFRVAVLAPDVFGHKYTSWAARKKDVVDAKIDTETGIVGPAINPLNWHDRNEYWSGSPEGQSFVVLLHAAERDWKASKGGY